MTDSQYPSVMDLSRRGFIKASAALGGGLFLGWYLPSLSAVAAPQAEAVKLNAYLRILPSGVVEIMSVAPEIGQGIKTSLPMIIADEMDADWSLVKVQQAPLAPEIYGRQSAGGSRSTPIHFTEHRQIGATARTLLRQAAAQHWQVPLTECTTAMGKVLHSRSGRQLSYGELAALAATLPLPTAEAVILKSPEAFTLIGKFTAGVDNEAIVQGQPLFGIDMELPGMLHAVYHKCPVFGGTVKTANLEQIKALPGVRHAFIVAGDGDFYGLVAGVAIVADSWWQAEKARKQLQVSWSEADVTAQNNGAFDTAAKTLWQSAPQQRIRQDGDATTALAAAAKIVEADYYYPFIAHGQLEPMNCTAYWQQGKLTLWAPTQNPASGRTQVAKVLGIPEQAITVNVVRMGGGFGRRLFNDYMAEAAWIAREIGVPVKLLWSRQDDFQHDFYRPAGYHRFRAGLDRQGKLIALQDHFVSFGNRQPLLAAAMDGSEFPAGFIAHLDYGCSLIKAKIPTGWLRAPSSNALAWVFQSILDEAAHAAGRDPLTFQLELLSQAQPQDDKGISAQRMTAVLKLVAERSGWGRTLPAGHGLGLACYYSHAGYFAEVVEASVAQGNITIHKVWAVGDVGEFIVNPSGALHQVQGSILEGLSQALYQEVLIDGGAKLSNYHQHKILSMSEVPEVDVHFLPSTYPTTGLGEPALPPIIPALCNALFAATGKRVRRLPIKAEMLV